MAPGRGGGECHALRLQHLLGQAFWDADAVRDLYLHVEWADDVARREQAGVPETVDFAIKPKLAERMLARTLDAGIEAVWVVAVARLTLAD